jgi:hypothetical protein
MKTYSKILNFMMLTMLVSIFLSACSGLKHTVTNEFDDVYFDNDDALKEKLAIEERQRQRYLAQAVSQENIAEDDYFDQNELNKINKPVMEEDYYDDYTSRLRRFNQQPLTRFDYYDPFWGGGYNPYANMTVNYNWGFQNTWYNPYNSWNYGGSFYNASSPCYGCFHSGYSVYPGNYMGYDPWYYNSWSMNNYYSFGSPYYGNNFYNPGYNNWNNNGWGNGWNNNNWNNNNWNNNNNNWNNNVIQDNYYNGPRRNSSSYDSSNPSNNSSGGGRSSDSRRGGAVRDEMNVTGGGGSGSSTTETYSGEKDEYVAPNNNQAGQMQNGRVVNGRNDSPKSNDSNYQSPNNNSRDIDQGRSNSFDSSPSRNNSDWRDDNRTTSPRYNNSPSNDRGNYGGGGGSYQSSPRSSSPSYQPSGGSSPVRRPR